MGGVVRRDFLRYVTGPELGRIGDLLLYLYLLLSIKISAWPTKTLKPPQPKPTIGYNFVNRAYGHPGGAGYRRG